MNNEQIEQSLELLPDLIADALFKWRECTLKREKVEALKYLFFKWQGDNKTATEIRALVNSDSERYQAVIDEIKAEADHQRLSERLMAAKKAASLRVAF